MRKPVFRPALLAITFISLLSMHDLRADTGPNWLSLGPQPVVPSTAVNTGGTLSPPVSGRATVLAVNPQNRYNIWLGTAGGGVWVSNNLKIGGLEAADIKPDPAGGDFDRSWLPQWFPHNSGLESLAIGAIKLADCTSNGCLTAYIGTGENSLRRDTYYGDGVYKVSWGGPPEFPSWIFQRLDTAKQFRYGSTAALVVDASEVFVALSAGNTTTSLYASVKAPRPDAGYGVHRRDAAGNWTRIFDTPMTGKERWADLLVPTDLEKIPGTADSFLLGVHNDGLFLTTDRGATWCALNADSRLLEMSQNGTIATPINNCAAGSGLPLAGSFDHVEIAVESSTVAYALLGNCPSGYTDSTQRATSLCKDGASNRVPFLFKSTNGGTTWMAPGSLSAGNYGHYSRYTHALWAAGGNQVLWGAVEAFLLNTDPGLTQSPLQANSLHLDIHDLLGWVGWDDGGDVLYAASDGGFYVKFGSTWKPGNDSLITTAFVSIGLDYEDEVGDAFVRTTAILGGLQDNSNVAYNGSPAWQLWGPVGDGGEALIQTPTITFDSIQNNSLRRIPGFNGSFSTSVNGARVGSEKDAPFYSALVQHEETKRVFVGTDVVSVRAGHPDLWSTGMATPAAIQISPVLGTADNDFPAIETDRDWITALAVAPSHGWRLYVGLYSGKLWRSTTNSSTQPQPIAAHWLRVDSGLPTGVISSIAVHPTDHAKLWVAYSDFIDQTVWYSDNQGASWSPRSNGLPAKMPVKVIKVDPDAPAKLWLGTDTAVYHSTDGGQNWQVRDANLPRVPVFDLEIDRHTKRIFAATHGRGVWMNTDEGPVLTTFEGWTEDGIWDIPIYGTGFTCTRSGGCDCFVDVIREDGVVCASSDHDALNRRVYIDNGGHQLNTTDIGSCTRCDGQPVVFGCFNGDCVGGVSLASCNIAGHRVASVKVRCEDNPDTTGSIAGLCPEQSNPPSNLFEVEPPLAIPTFAASDPNTAAPFSASSGVGIVLTPMVMASPANGGDYALCTAIAHLEVDDAAPMLVLRDAINASPACQAAGVKASVVEEVLSQGEDSPDRLDQRLAIAAPEVVGAQLVLGVGVPPGQAAGFCFNMSRLGVYLANQLAVVQLIFPTAPTGAAGGSISLTEISPVGTCTMRVSTLAGWSSQDIAQALAQAFQAPGVPSPGTCPEGNNPRDLVRDGASVVTILPTALRVCLDDPGIGLRFGPHGLEAEPPQIQIPGDVFLAPTCAGAVSVATLNICNSGKGDLLVNPITSSDPRITVTTPSSGYPVVISHDFCFPFQVKFVPDGAGPAAATLKVTSNDPLHPIVEVAAHGQGTVPAIKVTGSTDWGVVSAWSPSERVLEVCNVGGCPLEVSSIAVDCADFTLVDNPFPATIPAASCLDLTLGFAPTRPGSRRCRLEIRSNDPATPTVEPELVAKSPPSLALLVGSADPEGDLELSFRQGSALALAFSYPFRAHWSWAAELGLARLDGRPTHDLEIASFAVHASYTFNPASKFRAFIEAGPNAEHFDPGDFEAGIDFGLGLEIDLGHRFDFELHLRRRFVLSADDLDTMNLIGGFAISF